MLIGICGGKPKIFHNPISPIPSSNPKANIIPNPAKCAGKRTVAQYLVEHHGFKKLHIESPQPAETPETKLSNSNSDPEPTNPSCSKDERNLLALRPKNGLVTTTAASSNHHTFANVTDLLDFVTKHWRSRWVTTDIHSESVLDALSRRPFFILISVDAPVTVRWRRYQERHTDHISENISLEEFVAESDADLYDPHKGVLPLMSRAAIRLLNTSDSLAHLYATLGKLDLTDGDRLRPSWDSYFMALASLAARRCNCMKRAVGCVLVDSKRRVISTGYNGTPRHLTNCMEGGCPRCNSGDVSSGVSLATCLCLHAEENALLEAGRERIRDGSVLYCNTCPCLTCSIKIVQVGISEVVYNQGYSMDGETARVFLSAGIRLRQFSPVSSPPDGHINIYRLTMK